MYVLISMGHSFFNQLTVFNDIRHIQNLRWQNSWIHFETFSKAGHLNNETRWDFLKFYIG